MVKNVNGYDWQITSFKSKRGVIICNVQARKLETKDGYETFLFIMFRDPAFNLFEQKKRATENSVRETHELGLVEFTRRKKEATLPHLNDKSTL